ncbi:MAG TPA: hypothetical protein VLC07_03590 [Solirubrobacterales bacterium]|nr:hypothetical protein [Solirubrobacterales bacterium]
MKWLWPWWSSQAISEGEAFWAWGWGALLGLYIGRLLTMAYRRGTILRLERELAGYREFDEEDES